MEEELEPSAPCYEMQEELQEAWKTIAKTNKRLMLTLMEVVIQKKRCELIAETEREACAVLAGMNAYELIPVFRAFGIDETEIKGSWAAAAIRARGAKGGAE